MFMGPQTRMTNYVLPMRLSLR